jgi:hypothetical protein
MFDKVQASDYKTSFKSYSVNTNNNKIHRVVAVKVCVSTATNTGEADYSMRNI